MDYGAFCRLKLGVEGLIHQSMIDWTNRNIKPSKVFSVGQQVKVKVTILKKKQKECH